ncbi:MAG TPA: cytochrome c1 [Burkholderiales bacterium]|nr:cytochrome c1 [Burkholderiales bacterium]
MLRSLLIALLLTPLAAAAAGGGQKLDRANIDTRDAISIQRGAQVFVNYCLNCHSAEYMRYNRLTDLGLTEDQIRDNLMFVSDRVGDTMQIAMRAGDARQWFGVAPPDLSVVARSRGADWLYTYMRTFYRDSSGTTGWNNLAFPNAGMPHVLWELQGIQRLETTVEERAGHKVESRRLVLEKPGTMTSAEYDRLVRDLVNYLVYMGEPARTQRVQIGIAVLFALSILLVLTWLLKREYWRDVH